MNTRMDLLGSSECSSGCESGWTLYLDHSVYSSNPSHHKNIKSFSKKQVEGKYTYTEDEEEEEEEQEEEVEEDLSMVSDASSGPPHFNEDETCDDGHKRCSGTRQAAFPSHCRKKPGKGGNMGGEKERKIASFLDDTASSPLINFSNSNFGANDMNQNSLESALDYSQGFSATHFQGRPTFQDQFGFFQPSLPAGNQIQHNQWF